MLLSVFRIGRLNVFQKFDCVLGLLVTMAWLLEELH